MRSAQIRAALGHDAVVIARLHDGHLPEARYSWEPLERLTMPQPAVVTARPMIRRLYTPPIELPPAWTGTNRTAGSSRGSPMGRWRRLLARKSFPGGGG